MRARRAILLVTYKYLKTDARVPSNQVFSRKYALQPGARVKTRLLRVWPPSRAVSRLKPFEGKVAAECQEAGAILQGLLTLKSTKKQSRTHQPGLRYENTLSQPLNRVKKTDFFGPECLSPDFFSAYLIWAANNEIYFCNKI